MLREHRLEIPAEINLKNSMVSMSSRAFSSARPCCDIDSVMKIFFLLLHSQSRAVRSLLLFVKPSNDGAGTH